MKSRYLIALALLAILLATVAVFSCGDDDDDDDDSVADDDDAADDDDDDASDDDVVDDDDDDDDVFDPAALVGKTFHLNIPLEAWTEPVGVGDVIGFYVPVLLFGVTAADEDSIDFIAGVGVDDSKAITQDECVVTTEFTGASLDGDGNFATNSTDYSMKILNVGATLFGATLSGSFNTEGSAFAADQFGGMLDARELEEFFAGDADFICLMAGSFGADCVACPSDGEVYCVGIKAEDFTGDLIDGITMQTIEPDDIGPECDDDDDDDDDDDVADDDDDDTV